MILDQAGWYGSEALAAPANITLHEAAEGASDASGGALAV
jgi:hypothetical protein